MTDTDLLAVPDGQAARLAKITPRQLDYWARTGLVVPSIERRLGPRNRVRLYGFGDVLDLMTVSELLRRGRTLQQVRAVFDHLHRRGYDAPLRQLRYATAGSREVFFQHPDGTWEGGRVPDQTVIPEVIDLELLRGRLVAHLARPAEARGHVERQRRRLGNKQVFAGTRIPVATVRNYLVHGYSVDEILEAFPDLTPADVEIAKHFDVA
jgi:uncharacterized protein (DUF433 family)